MTLAVQLRDVTLRDGLQDEEPIPTTDKLTIYEALVRAGVTDLEVTSFVRPDRVPAMADAERIVEATANDGVRITRWGLVLNERGAQRALGAGLRNLQFVYSVSEAHNLRNAGRSLVESRQELATVIDLAMSCGAIVEVTLATAFGCPFLGPVAGDAVIREVGHVVEMGVASINLADTIGTGVPSEVASVTERVVRSAPGTPIGLHLHDTRGLAIANALAGVGAGATRLDASVGGLGGCPFAPGASGNVALEDLAHCLEHMGVQTGLDVDRLVDAARLATAMTGKPLASHIGAAGPRFRSNDNDTSDEL